jgi:hypothetical protein
MIRFSCPACGKVYQADDALAGRKSACKKCGAVVVIPENRIQEVLYGTVLPQEKVAEAPQESESHDDFYITHRRKRDARRRLRNIVVVSVGCSIGMICILALVSRRAGPVITNRSPIDSPRLEAPDGVWRSGAAAVRVDHATIWTNLDMMAICVEVSSTDRNRVVTLHSWSNLRREKDRESSQPFARLLDSGGNPCPIRSLNSKDQSELEITFDFWRPATKLHAGRGSGPVTSDKPRIDAIAFDRPAAGAEYVDLDLEAGHVGAQGQRI